MAPRLRSGLRAGRRGASLRRHRIGRSRARRQCRTPTRLGRSQHLGGLLRRSVRAGLFDEFLRGAKCTPVAFTRGVTNAPPDVKNSQPSGTLRSPRTGSHHRPWCHRHQDSPTLEPPQQPSTSFSRPTELPRRDHAGRSDYWAPQPTNQSCVYTRNRTLPALGVDEP